jgi:hypothetical protein
MAHSARIIATASLCAALAACAPPSATTETPPQPTAADALAFLDEVEREYDALFEEASRISWVQSTYINFDTDWLVANIGAQITELGVKNAKRAATFNGVEVPTDARRSGSPCPRPTNPARRRSSPRSRHASTALIASARSNSKAVPCRSRRPKC